MQNLRNKGGPHKKLLGGGEANLINCRHFRILKTCIKNHYFFENVTAFKRNFFPFPSHTHGHTKNNTFLINQV